jgi:hypothetical protein
MNGFDAHGRPRDLTLRGGRRRRRRYVVGMWLTVLVFTAVVLILTSI